MSGDGGMMDTKPYVREEQSEEELFKQTTTGINFSQYEDIPVNVQGKDVPPPINTFKESNLALPLLDNIAKAKFEKPTPIQKYTLPLIMGKRDIMACAQTGSGKTGAFLFPLISKMITGELAHPRNLTQPSPLGLIVAPTRELATQIYDEARKFTYQSRLRTVAVFGGADAKYQINQLHQGVHILVGTPGRLIDLIERGHCSLACVKYLVLDEADRCLDMGFEPQIRQILSKMPEKNSRQTLLYSATFPKEIQQLARDFLVQDYTFVTVGRVGSTTELITQKVELVPNSDKLNKTLDIIRSRGPKDKILIFTMTKRGAEKLERELLMNRMNAIAIHGDKQQRQRDNALKSFKSGFNSILVATDVAARGLDVDNIALVINYDFPKNIDDYVHRIGRTGRAGKKGEALSFYDPNDDQSIVRDLIDTLKESKQDVPPFLFEELQRSRDFMRAKRYGGRPSGGFGGRGGNRGGFGFGNRSGFGFGGGDRGGFGGDRDGFGGDRGGFGNGNPYSNGFDSFKK